MLSFWSVKLLLEDILLCLLPALNVVVVCNCMLMMMFGWHKTYVPSCCSGAGCFPVCQEETDNKCAHANRNLLFCHISLKLLILLFFLIIRFIDLFICF